MAITPSTDLKLIKLPIELDNKNQLTFTSKEAQFNYFVNLPGLYAENFTYQRKDNVIRYPDHIDNLLEYNYVIYRNTNYTDKIFYCFITDMTYVNDNMTYITIKTDVWQTWQFDIEFLDSFVEREHILNDIVGANTVPENVETGDYISCKLQPTFYDTPETCFVVATTEQITTSYTFSNASLPIGLYYYGLTSLIGIKNLIKILDERGKGDTVNSVFVTYKKFFSAWYNDPDIDGSISSTLNFEYSSSVNVTKVNYLGNDYTPKNNKLLTYPYSFLQVSNHSGQIINYHWENFNMLDLATTDITFNIKGAITPGGSIKAFPVNYNNILNNFDDNIVIGKLPIGAFNNDVYTNWLTQNGVNIGLNLLQSAGQIVGGAAMTLSGVPTSGASNMANGFMGVANTLGSVYEHSLIPDSVSGNVNTGDVNFTLGLTNLEFKRMSIKNEYAEIIDNYFSMYGYKTNRVKKPNLNTRPNWNFVKTIGANIHSLFPTRDLEEIKNLFDTGITLWHNPNTFLDYSQNN